MRSEEEFIDDLESENISKTMPIIEYDSQGHRHYKSLPLYVYYQDDPYFWRWSSRGRNRIELYSRSKPDSLDIETYKITIQSGDKWIPFNQVIHPLPPESEYRRTLIPFLLRTREEKKGLEHWIREQEWNDQINKNQLQQINQQLNPLLKERQKLYINYRDKAQIL